MKPEEKLIEFARKIGVSFEDTVAIVNYLKSEQLMSLDVLSEISNHEPNKEDYKYILHAWSTHCGHLHNVSNLDVKRKTAMRLRWQEMPNKESWDAAARAVKMNPFYNGKNDSGWKATFDFFIRPTKAMRLAEVGVSGDQELW